MIFIFKFTILQSNEIVPKCILYDPKPNVLVAILLRMYIPELSVKERKGITKTNSKSSKSRRSD